MTPAPAATATVPVNTTEPIDLTPGLPPEFLFQRLHQANTAGAMSNRMLAFYLEEMHARRIYQWSGHASTAHWAAEQLDMDERRARELVQIGAALLQNEELDAALLDGRLSWSRVAILAGIVMPNTQRQWIELAMEKSCAQLKADVARARQGRNPSRGSKRGLGEPRFRLEAAYGSEMQDSIERIREEVMRELGKLVTDDELFAWLVGVGMERVEARARRRQAAATPATERGPADRVPDRMRREMMVRDGYACRCCGSTTALHVHHVVFRQNGGATCPGNLVTVCAGCHGRIHAGLLFVRGEAPDGIEMRARTGEPLRRVPATAGDPVLRLLRTAGDGGSRGGHPPRSGPRTRLVTRPQKLDLNEIPAVVDRNWWLQHEHLLDWCGGRYRVKASARC